MVINAQEFGGEKTVKIGYSNDFFTGSDQYFTQGIHVEIMHPSFRKSPIAFLNFCPQKEALLQYKLGIQQDGFTPTSIRYDSILKNDRPYCASLYFTNSQTVCYEKKKLILTTQIDLGALGPLALGYEEQTAIHKAIGDELPKGWKNQIQNDLILNYKMELQRALIDKRGVDISCLSQARLGSMYSDISLGAHLRAGFKQNQYGGQSGQTKQNLQFFAFANAMLKAVAYNATFQGGLLNRTSLYTLKAKEISRLVASYEFGISTSYKRVQINYSHTYISKEFKTGQKHAWGKLSIVIPL